MESKRKVQQKQTVRTPLLEPIRAMIERDTGDKAEAVIDIIEGVVPTVQSDNVYNDLVEALMPVIDQKAKTLVGKILAYKKKMCRTGDSCRVKGCIYLHERERRNDASHVENDSPKRRRLSDSVGNSEVIFNKVNETVHGIEELRDYASKFGNILSLRRLNAEKYLVVFDMSEAADRLVRSTEAVLGDEGIKKFYNLMDNLSKTELKKLFEEQEIIVEKMYTEFSLNLLNQLKNVNFRIKNLVVKEKVREYIRTEGKMDFNQEQSLYYNCF